MAENNNSRIIGIMGHLEKGEVFTSENAEGLEDFFKELGKDYRDFACSQEENGDPTHRYIEIKTGREYHVTTSNLSWINKLRIVRAL